MDAYILVLLPNADQRIIMPECGLVMPYGITTTGLQRLMYNGLLPDGTKPLPESMFTYYQLGFVAFPLDHLASDISDQLLENDLCDIYFKFPRVNELNPFINMV